MADFRFLFTARDYERSVAFYTEILGLPVASSWDDPDGRGTLATAATGQIEILEHTGPGAAPRAEGVRIAWEVDDIDGVIDRYRAAGVTVVEEVADRPWGHRNATILDPDGLRITLFSVIGAGH